jgi:hypothetical protein
MIYESNCAALQAGVSVTSAQQCDPPDGLIQCLHIFCDAATEYCDVRMHYGPSPSPFPCDQGPGFSSNVCHPLPAGCGADPTCSCIAEEPFVDCPNSGNCSDIGNSLSRWCPSGCYG